MRSKKQIFFYLLILWPFLVASQPNQYRYKRNLENVSMGWHCISIPDGMYGKIQKSLADVRILGISDKKDTIEVPYIIRYVDDKKTINQVNFKRINNSKREDSYFFTFEIDGQKTINEIDLDFDQKNYDWLIKLEGSQDQEEWFEILENYRILSIHNELTDYSFSKIKIPQSDYRYYRLNIESETKPNLISASIIHIEIVNGIRKNYNVKSLNILEENKRTIMDISLNMTVPASNLRIDVLNDYDFYRKFTIQYLSDSFETEKGWKLQYSTLSSGTLSSMEDTELNFKKTILKRIKLIVENHDSEPLDYGECQVWGYTHELVARFSETADYYMIYGNASVKKPIYDITHFTDQIPEQLATFDLGIEQNIQVQKRDGKRPLFENKAWLWGVLILIMGILGYFSVRMIKSS